MRDAPAVVTAVDGADAVLSTLGVPFSMRPIDTYSAGIRNVVAAMQKTSVRRLVVVSSSGTTHYPNRVDPPFALRIVEPIITRTIGKTTYDDQRRMEATVRDSGLDWTIVHPSGLFDLPNVTEYIAGEVDPVGGFTSRTDLADYLVSSGEPAGAPRHGDDLDDDRYPDDVANGPPRSVQERVMTTAYLTVALTAIAANGFSGIAALLHFKPIMPGMAKAGVPVSWLTFPIGTLKTLGALVLLRV